MARLIYGMMQSLDGYIDGPKGNVQLGPPDAIVFRHFIQYVGGLDSILYGRKMYEVMGYWDEDKAEWDELEHEFAHAWRQKPKFVASRSLTSVGPNAELIQGNVIHFAQKLKAERTGDIDVAGAELANVLASAGLVDEYRLYFRPQVLGAGKRYFAGKVPPLRLLDHRAIGEETVQLTYVPA